MKNEGKLSRQAVTIKIEIQTQLKKSSKWEKRKKHNEASKRES
jgi:hypothetical protein